MKLMSNNKALNLLFCIILVVIQLSVFGQKTSIKAGFGFRPDILTFVNLGVGRQIKVNEKIDVLIELNRSVKGYSTYVQLLNDKLITVGDLNAGYIQSYLELPVQFKYFVTNQKRLSLNLGGYVAYSLAGKFLKTNSNLIISGKLAGNNFLNENFDSDLVKASKIDFGVNTGLSYKFKKNPFGLDLRYSQGFVGQVQKVFYYYNEKINVNEPNTSSINALKQNSNLEFSIFYQF
jgi:Outer membrane protein beta-barrel domain